MPIEKEQRKTEEKKKKNQKTDKRKDKNKQEVKKIKEEKQREKVVGQRWDKQNKTKTRVEKNHLPVDSVVKRFKSVSDWSWKGKQYELVKKSEYQRERKTQKGVRKE